MRRVLVFGLVCAMLLCLCACGKTTKEKEDSAQTVPSVSETTTTTTTGVTGAVHSHDDITFNTLKASTHAGSSLAAPTVVSKEDFTTEYDIRWRGMLDNASYKTEYVLYHYTEEATASMGLSGLCYGLIRVTQGERLAMAMYVSASGYAGEVIHLDDSVVPSRISNTKVYLVDATGSKNRFIYAQFRCGRNYITCQLYDCEQEDLVDFVRVILAGTPKK